MAQAVVKSLGQQQTNQDAPPRRLLPTAGDGGSRGRAVPRRVLVDQAHAAAGALQTLIEGSVALGTDHRHGLASHFTRRGILRCATIRADRERVTGQSGTAEGAASLGSGPSRSDV